MYRVYVGDKLIHDTNISTLRIHNAVVELELGKTGRFEFLMYEDHPRYSDIVLMTAGIYVYRGEENIFSGRVLRIEYGMYNEKKVVCEGELAFLNDTIIEADYHYSNFYEYFARLVRVHNMQAGEDKQFTVGKISFPDFAGYERTSDEYLTIFEAVNDTIIKETGGYLQVRNEGGVRYLDVLSYDDDTGTSNQPITLGKNLISLQRTEDGEDLYSAILPLGSVVNNVRVNIGSVNGWNNFIVNEDAYKLCGYVAKVVVFEGIADPQELKDAAIAYLRENYIAASNIEITMTDMSHIDDSYKSFTLGQNVTVSSPKHFAGTKTFKIMKMTINVSDPTQTRITVGKVNRGFVESIA